MAISTLIIGQDYPDGNPYLQAGLACDRKITLTANATTDSPPDGCCIWNRTSPVSAKNLIIKAEALTGQLDEAVIIFDPNTAAASFQGLEIEHFLKLMMNLSADTFMLFPKCFPAFLKKITVISFL